MELALDGNPILSNLLRTERRQCLPPFSIGEAVACVDCCTRDCAMVGHANNARCRPAGEYTRVLSEPTPPVARSSLCESRSCIVQATSRDCDSCRPWPGPMPQRLLRSMSVIGAMRKSRQRERLLTRLAPPGVDLVATPTAPAFQSSRCWGAVCHCYSPWQTSWRQTEARNSAMCDCTWAKRRAAPPPFSVRAHLPSGMTLSLACCLCAALHLRAETPRARTGPCGAAFVHSADIP